MKVKSVLFLLLFTLFFSNAFSQEKTTWKELSTAYRNEVFPKKSDDKKTTITYLPNHSDIEKPISLKDLEGKKISISIDPFTAYYCKEGVLDYMTDYENDIEGFSFTNVNETKYRGKFFKDESMVPTQENKED